MIGADIRWEGGRHLEVCYLWIIGIASYATMF